jgi:SpoVK/Ycf46/Vps4 family AAA+-type ATPase
MTDRNDEKNRLWNEVFSKKRTYEETEDSNIELTTDVPKENRVSTTDSILKTADKAMQELSKILNKQKDELTKMHEEIKETPSTTDVDIDALEKEIKQDYGVEETVRDFDSGKVFQEIESNVQKKILGQDEAVKKMCVAFRRPFVMGDNENGVKNVILVHGPHGSGKHATITEVTKELKQRNIIPSDEVYTMDMSRYTSASQEQIFLQDLYEALNGNGSVICFEKFESTFATFLRMISSLVTDGKVVLNKRYVLSKGVLVEAQTGLVKDAIDSLQVNNKYLVFITSGKVSAVQDAFGADFMYHVLDDITFTSLDDESSSSIIIQNTNNLIDKCKNKLHVNVSIDESIRSWVHTHFDKSLGADSIQSIFYDFYVSLSEFVLNENLGNEEEITMNVKDDIPYAFYKDSSIQLSREKNSAEEVETINKELNEIVGLDSVKKYIHSLQAHISLQEKRKQQGMKSASVSMHMIFTGNPGTGKTTIARLLARYLKAIGVLSEGQLVEVTRGDLVAQYVGQTAPLTMSVIKSALGGVLFIDEAYSLYRGKDDSFGLEAIDTLVKAMEDNRDNLIVVLAGYKKEMATFLESNSGLKSRFPNIINFEDYTGEQLYEIANIQAKSKGYEIEVGAKDALVKYFNEVQSINAEEAGNGRLARNLIESAILKQAERVLNTTDTKEMTMLKEEDFDLTVKVKPKEENEDSSLSDLMNMMKN